jgi:hypothetical protein
VQFTADQVYVDLLERARDLLWHQLPNGDLAQLQRLALEALVEKLMRREHGGVARSESTPAPASSPARVTCAPAAVSRHIPAAVPQRLAARRRTLLVRGRPRGSLPSYSRHRVSP